MLTGLIMNLLLMLGIVILVGLILMSVTFFWKTIQIMMSAGDDAIDKKKPEDKHESND